MGSEGISPPESGDNVFSGMLGVSRLVLEDRGIGLSWRMTILGLSVNGL